jgi:hypothetical protein
LEVRLEVEAQRVVLGARRRYKDYAFGAVFPSPFGPAAGSTSARLGWPMLRGSVPRSDRSE